MRESITFDKYKNVCINYPTDENIPQIDKIDFNEENFLVLKGYAEYIANELSNSIAYSEYLAENMDNMISKMINITDYLNLKYTKEFSSYLKYLEENKNEAEINSLIRKNKIKKFINETVEIPD